MKILPARAKGLPIDATRGVPKGQLYRTIMETMKRGQRSGSGGGSGYFFNAARDSRLLDDFNFSYLTLNDHIRRSLRKMRARSRNLAINNDYAKRFLSLLVSNVVGEHGFVMQAKVTNQDETQDIKVNTRLEKEWKEWCKPANCTVTKNMSWHEGQTIGVRTWGRDGEFLIRFVRGFDNPFGFALQFIPPDALDEQYTMLESLTSKNPVVMGVEYNEWGQPVNYYLRKKYDFLNYGEYTGYAGHEIVPASDIIHFYLPYEFDQARGFPLMHSAMVRSKMLEGYEDAHMVAARYGASKMGFYERTVGEDPGLAGIAEVKPDGSLEENIEAGIIGNLPPGYKFTSFDPKFPEQTFPDFVKATLRGMAAGLDVAYNSLANDLENVNYSSIRAGLMDERDIYKIMQKLFSVKVCHRVYEEWLKMALVSRLRDLKVSNFDRYNTVSFHGRRWPWVDPEKDVNAVEKEMRLGLISRQEVLNDKGRDLEDTWQQIANEKKMAEKMGLAFSEEIADTVTAAAPPPEDEGGNGGGKKKKDKNVTTE